MEPPVLESLPQVIKVKFYQRCQIRKVIWSDGSSYITDREGNLNLMCATLKHHRKLGLLGWR